MPPKHVCHNPETGLVGRCARPAKTPELAELQDRCCATASTCARCYARHFTAGCAYRPLYLLGLGGRDCTHLLLREGPHAVGRLSIPRDARCQIHWGNDRSVAVAHPAPARTATPPVAAGACFDDGIPVGFELGARHGRQPVHDRRIAMHAETSLRIVGIQLHMAQHRLLAARAVADQEFRLAE